MKNTLLTEKRPGSKGMEAIQNEVSSKKWAGISGSTLKMIAIITMLIDHTAAVVLDRIIFTDGIGDGVLYTIDMIMRLIGRLGFPIFCFLLIEGFMHTKNIKKYAIRLALFCVISEIPFDLAISGKTFYWDYQNVFFTLLIGLLVIAGLKMIEDKFQFGGKKDKIIKSFLSIIVIITGMLIAVLLKTDYSAVGVFTIVVMYVFRNKKIVEALMGCIVLTVMSLVEVTSFFVLIPIHLYNGKRGWNIKYFFYAFYPVHLLILYFVCHLAGYGNVILR